MKAMVLRELSSVRDSWAPLQPAELKDPVPAAGEILIEVAACGVCHTELDEIEGRTPPAWLPMVPGHQVVGRVVERGDSADRFTIGERVGVAWIYSACGACSYCRTGRENLCAAFRATGRDVHGGYAERMVVPQGFAYRIPDGISDVEAAPLLCAGAVGYRALRLTTLQDGQSLGLTGFGASGHLVLQMARYRYPKARVFVFARNPQQRAFARELGAVWAGGIDEIPPEPLDATIDTTPVWKPVVAALRNLAPGGRLVINAIRKEDCDRDHLLRLDYGDHLWMEREIKSVANVTRCDVQEALALAAEMGLKPEIQPYALEEANQALLELKTGKIHGAKVLQIACE
jgi:alcohol dehydrogenase, propanol-preferring